MASDERAAATPETPSGRHAPDAGVTSQATASPGIWGSLKQAFFGAQQAVESSDDENDSQTGGAQVPVPSGAAPAAVSPQCLCTIRALTWCLQTQRQMLQPVSAQLQQMHIQSLRSRRHTPRQTRQR